jgi:hypothetical protein
MRQALVFSAVFALFAASVEARQAMKLEIQNGRVSLEANGVPARQILAEWARIGGTKVVGAEKITGAPLTLKLVNMPERQALDIILRNAAGYMAAPRMASATPGASNYDRILILPTSTGAASSPATATNTGMRPGMAPGPMAGTERRVPMPRPPGMRPTDADADDPVQAEPEPDTADNGMPNPGQPVFTFPQPQTPGNQVFVPVAGGGVPGSTPQINLQPNPNGQPMIYNFVPQPNMTTPPTNGFGVIGSPTPGVVQQPPAQPGQPGQVPPKPPGRN